MPNHPTANPPSSIPMIKTIPAQPLKAWGEATVVTHSSPTFEVCNSNPKPYVGNLVVAYQWSTVNSTEPGLTVCTAFLSL